MEWQVINRQNNVMKTFYQIKKPTPIQGFSVKSVVTHRTLLSSQLLSDRISNKIPSSSLQCTYNGVIEISIQTIIEIPLMQVGLALTIYMYMYYSYKVENTVDLTSCWDKKNWLGIGELAK